MLFFPHQLLPANLPNLQMILLIARHFFPFQLRHRGFPGALLLKAGVGDGARRMCCVRLRLGGHRRSTGPRRSSRGPGDGGLEVGREGEAVRLLHRPGEAVAGRFRRGTSSPNKLASPKDGGKDNNNLNVLLFRGEKMWHY